MVVFAVLFLIFINPIYSQNDWLPNAGFEQWKQVGISEEPEFWGTLNQSSFIGGVVNAFKDTNAYEGSYALRLESKLHINPVDSTVGIYPGIAGLNSVFSENNMGYVDFNVKPIKIKGYFKSTVNSGDSCVIFGLLQKYSSLQNDYTDVGVFYKSFTSNVTTWTSFESFVYYYGQDRPERLVLLMIAGDVDNPTAGNVLCIDDLSFTYYASAIDDYVEVWPNTDITIPVLVNDEGVSLNISSVSASLNGTNQIISDKVLYTPDSDFKGRDEFDYIVCDILGECDTGHVIIDVNYGLSIAGKSNSSLIEVYPNPAKRKFNLNIYHKHLPASILIYNSLGQMVYNTETSQIENIIFTDKLTKGNYSVNIINKRGLLYRNTVSIN